MGNMTPQQKKILKTGGIIAGVLLVLLLLIGWIIPGALRSVFVLKYRDLIDRYSKENGLDPYYVCGVIFTESRFDPEAVSRVGATGLMQIMPQTGEEIAEDLGESYSPDMLLDPEVSIRYGTYYLKKQIDRFEGKALVALAAYNAGPSKAEEWLSEYGLDSDGKIAYVPYKETKNYVERIMLFQKIYQALYPRAFS